MKVLQLFASILVLVHAGNTLARESVEDCRRIVNNLERLTCYDRLYPLIVEKLVVVEESEVQQKTLPNVEKYDEFSRQQQEHTQPTVRSIDPQIPEPVNNEPEDVKKMFFTIVSVKKDPLGKRTFQLDNGESWKEQARSRLRVKQNEHIYIERGLLGTFYLSKDDVKLRAKVKRIK